jgi:L-fuculose-phosphate aldolase
MESFVVTQENGMLLTDERLKIVEYGKKLISSQLTTGSGGNLSIYNREEDLVAIKPSGVDYSSMTPEDIVIVNVNGEIIQGDLKPSSEIKFHLALYKYRSSVRAIIHTHQVYATTFACLNWEIPAVHYLVGFCGDKVPIAPYATYGTQELSNNILQSIGQYNACLMANHGIVTVGETLEAAFTVCDQIELVARIYYNTKCLSEPVILSDQEMKIVQNKFKTYGQAK